MKEHELKREVIFPSSEFILIYNCSGGKHFSTVLAPPTAAGGGTQHDPGAEPLLWLSGDVTANHSTAWTAAGCAPGLAHAPHLTVGSELHPFSLCAVPLSPGRQGGKSLPDHVQPCCAHPCAPGIQLLIIYCLYHEAINLC